MPGGLAGGLWRRLKPCDPPGAGAPKREGGERRMAGESGKRYIAIDLNNAEGKEMPILSVNLLKTSNNNR